MSEIRKYVERSRGKHFMRIKLELRENHSTLSDGFSVTGELYEPHGTRSGQVQYRNGRDCDMGGMLHDEILQFAPELAPVIAVHLADPNGTPMHAVVNGWYFYTGKSREHELEHYGEDYANRHGTPLEQAARALHIPVTDLPEGMSKEEFEAFAEGLRERWTEQARVARAIIEGIDNE